MRKQTMAMITASVMLFSSAVAVNAAPDDTKKVENKPSYSDVRAGSDYFDAIELLNALDIMDGYEGGLFKPNQKLTRAEFTKIAVTAMGEAEIKTAQDSEGRDTIFKDVKADHWAAGFITAAASNGLVNGMGDGNFKPEEKVTYAQAVKILICMIGYSQWAEDMGAWPDGCMYWANQIKIGRDIENVSNDDEITRGQAAQMIKNAMLAPLVIETHMYSYDIYGNKYSQMEQMNGNGKDFNCLLMDRYDVYSVNGYMSASNEFIIDSARNFNNEYYSEGSNKKIDITTSYGSENIDINADAFIKSVDEENTLIYMY